jgi:hypothetical protein
MATIPESARLFMSGLIERARRQKKTIVFPEGSDSRVREAAARLSRDGVVNPVLIGPKPPDARALPLSTRPILQLLRSMPLSIMNGGAPEVSRRWKRAKSRVGRSTSRR